MDLIVRPLNSRSYGRDMRGERFGLLVVVQKSLLETPSWECHCDCGGSKVVSAYNLISKRTKSCGCLKAKQKAEVFEIKKGHYYKDLTGVRFGRLVALRPIGRDWKHRILWECKCDCGTVDVWHSHRLSNARRTNSCGCLKREAFANRRKEGSAFKVYLRDIKAQAKKRGLLMTISDEEVKNLTGMCCHYCGSEPANTLIRGCEKFVYNGIDRIDSALGYESGNVISACGICNLAKKNLSYNMFKSWIKKAYEWQNLQP